MSKIVDDLKSSFQQIIEDIKNKSEEEGSDEDFLVDHFVVIGIAEDSLAILEKDDIVACIDRITNNFKSIPDYENTVSSLLTIMITAASSAAYRAVIRYDDLLKRELNKNFDNIIHHTNLCKADIEGMKAAIQVNNKAIGEIQKQLQIASIKKENGVE